ncbi:MAG: N-formylglutamate amidohydrolase [Planctomycetota bacterium]
MSGCVTRRWLVAVLTRRLLLIVLVFSSAVADAQLLILRDGELPVVISAPHGGRLEVPGATVRTGEGLKKGPSGFFTGRDTGTEELALRVVELLDEKLAGRVSCVISRVHRRYVDFNRPLEIGVEHQAARVVHDSYHESLRSAVRRVRRRHGRGLLIDIHGQGSSAITAFRGTSNGLTVKALRERFQDTAHTGPQSLTGLLQKRGWMVHPDPFTGKEQSGYTGGYIVRTYGSHQPDGIDAIQLELGADYRREDVRERRATELADAVVEYVGYYLRPADR